jgi:hypothetical protein
MDFIFYESSVDSNASFVSNTDSETTQLSPSQSNTSLVSVASTTFTVTPMKYRRGAHRQVLRKAMVSEPLSYSERGSKRRSNVSYAAGGNFSRRHSGLKMNLREKSRVHYKQFL